MYLLGFILCNHIYVCVDKFDLSEQIAVIEYFYKEKQFIFMFILLRLLDHNPLVLYFILKKKKSTSKFNKNISRIRFILSNNLLERFVCH